MKKHFPESQHASILTYLYIVLLSLFAPSLAYAQNTWDGAIGVAQNNNGSFPQVCNGNGIMTALGCIPYETKGFTSSLLTFLAGTAGAISLVVMLAATIQIMTGGDNAEQVKKGKELFTGAITGLLFIIFSVTLLKIIAGDIIQLPGFK